MKINNIKFHTPIVFDQEFIKQQKPVSRFFIKLGQLADTTAHVGKSYIKASTLEKEAIQGYKWKTALKVIAFILTGGLLLGFTLIAKAAYKNWVKKQLAETTQEPKPITIDQPEVHDKPTVEVENKPTVDEKTQLKAQLSKLTFNLKNIQKRTPAQENLYLHLTILDQPFLDLHTKLQCLLQIFYLLKEDKTPLTSECAPLAERLFEPQPNIEENEIYAKKGDNDIVIEENSRPPLPFHMRDTSLQFGKIFKKESINDPKAFNDALKNMSKQEQMLIQQLKIKADEAFKVRNTPVMSQTESGTILKMIEFIEGKGFIGVSAKAFNARQHLKSIQEEQERHLSDSCSEEGSDTESADNDTLVINTMSSTGTVVFAGSSQPSSPTGTFVINQ